MSVVDGNGVVKREKRRAFKKGYLAFQQHQRGRERPGYDDGVWVAFEGIVGCGINFHVEHRCGGKKTSSDSVA